MKENAQQPSPDYETVSRLAALAASDILRSIQDALRQLGDSHLIRASVDSWRIKSEQSLMRKAGERQWATLAEAIDKAPGSARVPGRLPQSSRCRAHGGFGERSVGAPGTVRPEVRFCERA